MATTGVRNRWNIELVLTLLTVLLGSTQADIVSQCVDTCQTALASDSGTGRVACDESCLIDACNKGCELWSNTTAEACTADCESTFSQDAQVQQCRTGCSYAEDEYATVIKAQIGSPSEPYVVSMESVTNVSVTIGWPVADQPEVSYVLQWRYVNIEGSTWTAYHKEPVSVDQTSVTGLHPFVTYKFRIQWVITPRHVLSSPGSDDVTTDPYGPPLSSPMIKSLLSPSPTTVAVSWREPDFPSGVIIQHTVTIEDGSGYRVMDGVTATTYTFTRLQPGTSYTVTVESRNAEGVSPEARRDITTQPPLNDTGIQPFLVVGVTAYNYFTFSTESFVSFTPLDKINDGSVFPSDLHIVDVENSTIADVSVHYWQQLLYLSDTSGAIHRRSVNVSDLDTFNTSSEVIYSSAKVATLLSVDWLFDHLYFVEENQILRCDLSCSQTPEVVVTDLDSVPVELQVDPYNGYIYWAELKQGIYRLDLAQLSDVGRKESVVSLDGIETFMVDPSGSQLIYPYTANDSILSSFLDGSAESVLRHDEDGQGYYKNVSNIAHFNNLFVWTRPGEGTQDCFGSQLVDAPIMHFETASGVIHVSQHFSCASGYHGFDVYHPLYQPVPSPVAPPMSLQVLFSDTTAEVSWDRIPKLDSTGEGAWQEWMYEIEVTDPSSQDAVVIQSGQGVTASLTNLTAETQYSVRVRGFSAAANGPWSETFVGSTLKQVTSPPRLVFASTNAIKMINLDGTGLSEVINQTGMIRDFAWDGDLLYWCDSTGAVYQTNMADAETVVQPLPFTSYTEALAVDWFTGRLFRGTSNQQDLTVDSLRAYVYWTTTKTVQCSHFNGDGRFDYARISGITDDLFAGLTLDLSGGFLYWFSLTSDDSVQSLRLFRAQLAGTGNADPASTTEEVGVVPSDIERVALSFYSQKLFWINSEEHIVLGNVNGNSLAALPNGDDATTLSVIQDTLHPLPDGFSSMPTVVPTAIPAESIQISGPWQNFNVTWQASFEVNYGTVFYDISVSAGGTDIVQDPVYTVIGLEPFQDLTISVQAYTYWGTASPVTVNRMSPMSVPTVPLNPRAFATEDRDILTGASNYTITFRWEPVERANGILLGYRVNWGPSMDALMPVILDSTTTELVVDGLGSNMTYFLEVEGFTSIGTGPATTLLTVSTQAPSPPPLVVSAGPDGLLLTDEDSQTSTELLGGDSVDAVAMVFIAQEELIFWADATKRQVIRSNFDGSNEENLFAIEELLSANGLVVDWLSRCLYIIELDTIYKYDTTLPVGQTTKRQIVGKTGTALSFKGLSVDPLTSRLYWTEQDVLDDTRVMTSDLEGQGSQPLFGGQGGGRRRRQACSCSGGTVVSGAVVIDQSDPASPEIYFADGITGDVWASDLDGCLCRRVVAALDHPVSGLPPDSLTVDGSRVYWTNTNQRLVASADKVTGQDFRSEVKPEGQVPVLAAFGESLQPYPDPSCLAPPTYSSQADLVTKTWSSLSLALPASSVLPQCAGISRSLVTYTVHYGKADSPLWQPLTKTSTLSSVVLEGLDPYTNYSIRVSAQNYYTVGVPVQGPEVTHMTSIGAPSEARNVTVTILDPQLARVDWLRPLEPNGPAEGLRYKVRYSRTANGTERIAIGYLSPSGDGRRLAFQKAIGDLLGGQEYRFQVEAYPDGIETFFSQSQTVAATTFQLPNKVVVLSGLSDALNVSWTSPSDGSVTQHRIEYLYVGYRGQNGINKRQTQMWISQESENQTEAGTEYTVLLTDLSPYSIYQLRAHVTYVTNRTYDYSQDEERIVTGSTDAALPEVPSPPEIIERTQGFDVRWTKPLINGPEDGLVYLLQAKASASLWRVVYEGGEDSWQAANLTQDESYTFRVAARSTTGLGPYSATSQPQVYVTGGGQQDLMIIIVAAVVAVLVLLAVIVILLIIRRKMKKDDKWKHDVSVSYRADTELATLRQYPTTIVQKDNSLYAVTTTVDGKQVELPIFPRERLKLITFLGSGAFGEVFEGQALNIHGPESGEAKVAVKTLRQGATDQEKEEFLKEAVLMGNFHDKNILALLGVCLDNDPQFIIMELMEGGDLLSYIRGARGTSITPCRLSPLDLIDIVIDVAMGCRYLESLKFVHRDLAARNCLVSTKDYVSPERTVKIGDFGLARDIYKSDYYRKEGEGLLPVRWMSPEALMDGVFTVQSDVWAFGVLVWEVMTLGQQPYPARTNVEVLHYVTAGGRLDRPDNCPDDIHHLMLKCWEKHAEGRPSFHSSLEQLHSYRRKSASMSSGVDNPAFDNGSIKYLRLGGGQSENDDYLQPMDSAQSLGRRQSTDLAEIKAKAQEDARRYQEGQALPSPDAYSKQGARPKPCNRNSSLGLPTSPVDREPRYTAAPSSFSKATGAAVAKPDPAPPPPPPPPQEADAATGSAAPKPKKPLNMKGSWVDPKKKEKRMQKAAEDKKRREEAERKRRGDTPGPKMPTVVVMDEPQLVSQPQATAAATGQERLPSRRAPNPFRQDSGDEADRVDYTNWPKNIQEDHTVYQV